jgi:hypothetical protein
MTKQNQITLIIFSKNRAMQLDALLRSIKQNCDIFSEIIVQYDRDPQHQLSYHRIAQQYQMDETISFIRERHFSDVKTLVSTVDTPYICFMVDDDIIYRDVYENGVYPKSLPFWVHNPSEFSCFSLRLGDNIKRRLHFEYPLSVDGHIFHTNRIQIIVEQIDPTALTNPNRLETIMQGNFAKELPRVIMRYEQSFLVGVPVNMVSNTSKCAYGTHHPYSTEGLLSNYLLGYRIDLDALDFGIPDDVHKEIELKFFNMDKKPSEKKPNPIITTP